MHFRSSTQSAGETEKVCGFPLFVNTSCLYLQASTRPVIQCMAVTAFDECFPEAWWKFNKIKMLFDVHVEEKTLDFGKDLLI